MAIFAHDHTWGTRHSNAAWYDLPLTDRLSVIQYIKYELAVDRSNKAKPYAYFTEEPPGPPLYIGRPPPPTRTSSSAAARCGRTRNVGSAMAKAGRGMAKRPPV